MEDLTEFAVLPSEKLILIRFIDPKDYEYCSQWQVFESTKDWFNIPGNSIGDMSEGEILPWDYELPDNAMTHIPDFFKDGFTVDSIKDYFKFTGFKG